MAAARIKGVTLINTIAILREVVGLNQFQAVVEACPPETRQIIRRTLVALEWVPLELWSPFMQAVFELACRKNEQQYRRLLRAVCKRDFNTIYRTYVNGTSPQEVLTKVPAIWAAYFDSGSLTVKSDEVQGNQERATLQMDELATSFPLHALTIEAYLEQLMVMAGAKGCSVKRGKDVCQDGKLSCDYTIQFEVPAAAS